MDPAIGKQSVAAVIADQFGDYNNYISNISDLILSGNYNNIEDASAEVQSRHATAELDIRHLNPIYKTMVPILKHKDDDTVFQNIQVQHHPHGTYQVENAHSRQVPDFVGPNATRIDTSYIHSVPRSDEQNHVQNTGNGPCAQEENGALYQALINQPSTQPTTHKPSPDLVLHYQPCHRSPKDSGHSTTCLQGKQIQYCSVPSISQSAKSDLVLRVHWEEKLGVSSRKKGLGINAKDIRRDLSAEP
jgi:hypothetical protein